MKDVAVVYMVAGISSRFGGRIKQLIKVGPNGETFMEYSLNQAIQAGFNKIVFIVGNKTEKPFKELFGSSYKGIPILYTHQKYDEKERDKPWGTTDALCCALKEIDCPFVVCNGDDIYGENTFRTLFRHLEDSEEEATIGFRLGDVIPKDGAVKRGIFQIKNGYVQKLVEVFDIIKSNLNISGTKLDDLCSMNVFALHPETLKLLNEEVVNFKEEHKGDKKIETLLPNDISKLIESEKIKMKILTSGDKWIGVTNPEDEEIVRETLSKKI